MTPSYPTLHLEGMLSDLSSELVERKESLDAAAPVGDGQVEPIEQIRRAVCAFANDLPGHGQAGVVFVGARQDGRPSGTPVTERLLQRLADIRTDGHTLPPPAMSVERRTLNGAEVAVIVVQPSDAPPVRARGQIRIRAGPIRAIASRHDERVLCERRLRRDAPPDLRPMRRATLADLDLRRFAEDYLPRALDPAAAATGDRTTAEHLVAARMIHSLDDPVPTVAGMLALGRSPQEFLPCAHIHFRRMDGADYPGPILDEARLAGDVSKQLAGLFEKLDAHNQPSTHNQASTLDRTSAHSRTPASAASGPLAARRAPPPPHARDALRQVACNAVMHRTYEDTQAPVRVTWYDDRVEITSPGGLHGEVTAERLGRPGVADYRNPSLAGAMRVLGLVRRFGEGIGIARAALRRNEQPEPDFKVTSGFVRCTIRARASI